METLKELFKNELFRGVLVLLLGVTIGVLFYPAKQVEEKVSQKYEQQISSLKESFTKEQSSLKETISSLSQENTKMTIESERKIARLSLEIKDLKSKQKTAYYKVVRPDGTIEIKKFSETEVTESTKVISEIKDEFNTKIAQIESKWTTLYQDRLTKIQKEFESKESDYKNTISQLESSKTTTLNPKKFGLSIGILSDKSYYSDAIADIWGPLYIGVHGEIDKYQNDNKLGLSLGLRF